MSNPDSLTKREGVVLLPGEGRSYPMGRISSVFKADGALRQPFAPGAIKVEAYVQSAFCLIESVK